MDPSNDESEQMLMDSSRGSEETAGLPRWENEEAAEPKIICLEVLSDVTTVPKVPWGETDAGKEAA